jgi:hypothetical protein
VGSRASVGNVNVGGSMIATSIAAGIRPGAGGQFGTADDAGMTWAGLVGTIDSVIVKWMCVGSTDLSDSYAVVAHSTIGKYSVGSKAVPMPWLYGNIRMAQNWR